MNLKFKKHKSLKQENRNKSTSQHRLWGNCRKLQTKQKKKHKQTNKQKQTNIKADKEKSK